MKLVHLALAALLLAPACGTRKGSAPEQNSMQARKDSLMQKSEQVLRQEAPRDTSAPAPAGTSEPAPGTSAAKQPVDKGTDEVPRLPESLPRVDVTLWAGMTWEKLDRLLGEFSLTTPPSIRYYGICDKIVFGFDRESPKAKLRSITCQLGQEYWVREALPLLGIALVKEAAVNGKEYVESTFGNEGIARVRSFISGPELKTRRILITYK